MAENLLRISKDALRSMTSHVTRGFETVYKREVGGHLLGYKIKGGFYVGRAVPYNSRYSSRSGWGTIQYYFRRKGFLLETKRLKWIGTYHSHVEIKGSASTGQSKEDKEAHICSGMPIEIIVRITKHKMRSPKLCLSINENRHGRTYYYDICSYLKDKEGTIRIMKIDGDFV